MLSSVTRPWRKLLASSVFPFPHHEKSLVAGPLHEDDNLGVLTVQGISMDDIALRAKVPIDFVKMDIEGAEWAALQGAEKVLNATLA